MSGRSPLTIEQAIVMPLREVEKLSTSEKKDYYGLLRKYCKKLGRKYSQDITATQKFVGMHGKRLRSFPIEIIGAENMPDGGCLVMCNHSNVHDILIMAEVLATVNKPSTVMLGVEGISPVELALFKSARSTMINRSDKISASHGLFDLTGKLLNGDTCLIFGEGTWNLHPYKPMQNIKIGGAKAAAIANVPIVPTILEYVEVPELCSKEKELYSKCTIKIAEPYYIDSQKSLIEQNDKLQTIMENMRVKLWKENGTYRASIKDVNPHIYINHTWMKKYGSFLFNYDSERESRFLYVKPGEVLENEWRINKLGEFRPGIIEKKSFVPR